MDSCSYLLTNEDTVNHLQSVAANLNENGIYILEMNHPSNVFNVAKTSISTWEVERGGCKVKIRWGSDSDPFDPITQITKVSVRLEYDDHGKHGVIEDQAPQRAFTANEFAALVKASGVFEIVHLYGAMDSNVPFSNEKASWRMIPVLRKI